LIFHAEKCQRTSRGQNVTIRLLRHTPDFDKFMTEPAYSVRNTTNNQSYKGHCENSANNSSHFWNAASRAS
jgi:hypothetical protein